MDARRNLPDGRPRARGLGLPFVANCGVHNAITDVPGVEVGFTTLIEGEGDLVIGEGPVRTGVTAILPRGHTEELPPVWAAMFSFLGMVERGSTRIQMMNAKKVIATEASIASRQSKIPLTSSAMR